MSWTCPRCDRVFGRKNQSHVCLPAISVEAYVAARPAWERPIWSAVVRHASKLAGTHVEAVGVGILLKRARTFAELRPKRERLELSLLLSRVIAHGRMRRVIQVSPTRAAHLLDLCKASDFDREARDWLTEAYLSSPE